MLYCGVTFLISADWEIFGVLLILFIHIFRDRPKERLISYIIIAAVWKGMEFFWLILGGTFGAQNLLHGALDLLFVMLGYMCMTVFYNGEKGKHPVFAKWFFYIFYPVHYLIIWAVYMLIR